MSLTVRDLYLYAKLATAGYVDLTDLPDFEPATLQNKAAAEPSPRMPISLGGQFFVTEGWRVVSDPRHLPILGGTHNDPNSGFAATLFQRGTAGEKVLAIRGTEPRGNQFYLDVLKADVLEIGMLGIAVSQTVSLFNLLQRMLAEPDRTDVRQLTLRKSNVQPAVTNFVRFQPLSLLPVYEYFWLEADNTGIGVGGISATDTMTVVGHSLGGHLAAMAHRLFPGIFPQAIAFNSARYDPPTSVKLTSQFLDLFRPFGASPGAGFTNVQMFDSEDQAPGNDASVVSSLISGTLFGPLTQVTTEANSHVIEPLMGSLALHALMHAMNVDLTLTDTGRLFEAISSSEGNTDEALLRALYKVLKGGDLSTTDVPEFKASLASAGDISARQKFYERLIELETTIKNKGYQLISLADWPASDLERLAQGSEAFGLRYALKELNPFAVAGNNAIYDQHNQKGELSLFGPANQTGALTREWIGDRAGLLQAVLAANTKDNPEIARIPGAGGISTQYHYYADGAERILFADPINRDPRGPQRTQIVAFADDNGRTLIGTDFLLPDRLYGGSGNDILEGRRANDYLEGGRGNDTYVWNTGDGFDTIVDTDGVGKVIVNGRAVSGGIKVAQNDYVNASREQLLHFEGDPITGGTLLINGDLKIENFANGDFGIVLADDGDLSELQPTATLFQGPFPTGIGFGTSGPDRMVANGLDGILVAKGGDDFLQVSDGALGPRLAGGSGQDLLIGANHEGGAEFSGDAGQDILLGGPNIDHIWGDFPGFQLSDFEFRGSNFRYLEPSPGDPPGLGPMGFFNSPHSLGVTDTENLFFDDYFQALQYVLGISEAADISSNYDDYLDGGRGNDSLSGGRGSDILFGGSGNDVLDGDELFLQIQLGEARDAAWRDAITRLFGQPGDDYLDGGNDDDRLADRHGGNDVLIGGPGHDTISSSDPLSENESYSNHLEGNEGNDSFFSSNRSLDGFDVLLGGPGNDMFEVQFGRADIDGGAGSDRYVVRDRSSPLMQTLAPQNLVINDFDGAGGDVDRLQLLGLSDFVSALFITRDESNLYIGRGADPDWITVENWFSGPEFRIEQIVFDIVTTSGLDQVYDVAAIESRFTTTTTAADFLWGSSSDEQLAGGLGDDTLFGGAGHDTLAGNEGSDTLDGGDGADVYVFNIGDGIDRINDTGGFAADVISFGPGITQDTLTLGLGSLLINVGQNGDAIHLDGFDPNDARNSSNIESFQFAHGTTLTYQQLLDRGFDLSGTDGPDLLSGTNVTDRFNGGQGSDVYFFGRGSGQDVIEDLDAEGDDVDTVLVEEGITPDDVSTSRADESIVLSINGTPDTLAIRWQPEAGYGIERVEFSDGTLWDAAALESRAIVEEAPPLASTPPDDSPGEPDLPVRPAGGDDRPVPADPPPGNGEQPAAEGDPLLPPPAANRGGASLQSENSAPSVDQTEPATGASPPPPVAGGVLSPPRAGRRFREHDDSAEIEERLDALIEDWFEHPRHNAFFVGSRLRGDDVLQRDAARSNKGAQLQQTHDEIATYWHRTKAQLEAHFASSDAEALGADDGVAFFPIPGGFGAIGPPPVGDRLTDIGGHQMRRLEGLREGLAILAA